MDLVVQGEARMSLTGDNSAREFNGGGLASALHAVHAALFAVTVGCDRDLRGLFSGRNGLRQLCAMSVVVTMMAFVMGVTAPFQAVQDDVRRPREEQAQRERHQARIPPEGIRAHRFAAGMSLRPGHGGNVRGKWCPCK